MFACDLTTTLSTTSGTTGGTSSSSTGTVSTSGTTTTTGTVSTTISSTSTTFSSLTQSTSTTTPSSTTLTTTSDTGSTTSTTSTATTTTLTTTITDSPDFLTSPYGFAALSITARTGLESGFYSVDDEVAFLDALASSDVQIIEITADLDLGFNEVSERFALLGRQVSEVSSVYRRHSHLPALHPVLISTGVGRLLITDFDGLLIYSPNGSEIRHCGISIDRSSDIVFRNLSLNELWEWDEASQGAYDVNDWDYFTIEDSSGIWLDHMDFHRSYDGLMDVKSGVRDITISWSRLVFEPDSFIETQMNWLEEHIADHSYYRSFRTTYGVSAEAMVEYASYQKKGFNLGNTTDGTGFESITVTFHHLYVKNLCDRLPRLRKGDVHLYHCELDNTGIFQYNISHGGPDLTNQGIVTTEGGAVLMENCIFRYVASPIKNNQKDNTLPQYSGEYRVVNSQLVTPTRDFFGSSGETGTLWTHSNASAATLEFGFRNYAELPYSYELADVYYLAETFALTPPGTIQDSGWDWTVIRPYPME